MSSIKLTPNASGTGAFTIAAPNSNTDRTLTLPDATGTILTTATPGVPVNGPAFSAFVASFSCTTATNVLAPMGTERFDTAGCYNNTGSTVGGIPAYAFKPTVAGYYLITSGVQYAGPGYAGYYVNMLYKNGSAYVESVSYAAQYSWTYLSTVVYLDGVNDYLQIYALQLQGTTQSCATNMSAALVRAA